MSFQARKVKATLIERRGICPYEVGYTVIYGSPLTNTRPDNVCWGIVHPLSPIVLACALGFKSWEVDDPDRYYVSCLSKKGTVWRVETMPDLADDVDRERGDRDGWA